MTLYTDKMTISFVSQFCKQLIENNGWNSRTQNQVLSIWTTLCLFRDLTPDTYAYDDCVYRLYESVTSVMSEKTIKSDTILNDIQMFTTFLCEHLV